MADLKSGDGYTLRVGQAVKLHPVTNAWISGYRYGVVESIGRKRVKVRAQRLGQTRTFDVHPSNLLVD